MKHQEHQYYSTFSSVIKPVVSEDKDKYLALASMQEVKAFIPEIDVNTNYDLLPIAFNACVVNRVNKNDDVIDTDTALAIYKNFLYKQINIEHNRKNVIGVILTAGFSEFGTDKPLTEEQVKEIKGPFNITLGGVLWRVVDNDIASLVEESNDPTSESYRGISASWELGFTGYSVVVLPAGQKNIEQGIIISEASDVEKYRPSLKALKGSGVLEDGRRVYRKPSENVTPLGIGATKNPAAEVKGIVVKDQEDIVAKKEGEEEKKEELPVVTQEKISQASNLNVNIERITHMIIKTIKDITDENLKQTNASAITDFISSELATKSKEWETEKSKFENQVLQAQADHKRLTEDYSKLQESFKTLQATVDTLNNEKIEKEKVEKFNARMNEISANYNLDDEIRLAVVEEIKALASDEDFAKWKKKAAILFKSLAKEQPKKDEAEASAQNKDIVVDEALDKAKKDKAGLPNSSGASEPTLKEKYAGAFAMENFVISK